MWLFSEFSIWDRWHILLRRRSKEFSNDNEPEMISLPSVRTRIVSRSGYLMDHLTSLSQYVLTAESLRTQLSISTACEFNIRCFFQSCFLQRSPFPGL
jgi:hypothetical protein